MEKGKKKIMAMAHEKDRIKAEETLADADKLINTRGRKRLALLAKKKANGEIKHVTAKNRLRALQPWHLELLKDRYVYNIPFDKLADKYETSRAWAVTICKSDVGILAAQEIINTPDVSLVRNKLKWLTGSALTVCQDIIQGTEKEDGITKLERGKFALDLMKIAGVPDPKEHKFTFEHVFKKAGEVVEEAGQFVEAKISDVINNEVKKIALEEE